MFKLQISLDRHNAGLKHCRQNQSIVNFLPPLFQFVSKSSTGTTTECWVLKRYDSWPSAWFEPGSPPIRAAVRGRGPIRALHSHRSTNRQVESIKRALSTPCYLPYLFVYSFNISMQIMLVIDRCPILEHFPNFFVLKLQKGPIVLSSVSCYPIEVCRVLLSPVADL